MQPDLGVIVTAPRKAKLESVLAKVRKRGSWIQQQQQYFREFLPQMPPRRYVSGETHRYMGRQYRLKVVEAKHPEVKLRGSSSRGSPDPPAPRPASPPLAHPSHLHARRLLESRRKPRHVLVETSCQPILRALAIHRLWVTHELCHAVHGNHGKEFYQLLRRVMPDWEQQKARLERVTAE